MKIHALSCLDLLHKMKCLFCRSIGAVALLHSSPAVSQNLSHDKKTVFRISTWYWAVSTHTCSLIEILVVLGIWKMWKLRRSVGKGLVFVSYCNVQQHKAGEQDMPVVGG